jgi:hypothetical protein
MVRNNAKEMLKQETEAKLIAEKPIRVKVYDDEVCSLQNYSDRFSPSLSLTGIGGVHVCEVHHTGLERSVSAISYWRPHVEGSYRMCSGKTSRSV